MFGRFCVVMNTTQLKYALEIEKTGSITAAAQNLYLSQPNLSKAIKELEGEVGMKIFQRSTRGVVPTRAGREFLANAKVVYNQIVNFDEMYTMNRSDEVNITLCIPRATYISMAFTDFLNTISDRTRISINIRERSTLSTLNYVTSGQAQLGVVRYQDIHETYLFDVLSKRGLDFEPLLEFEPVIVMSRFHPLADKAEIIEEDLAEYIELVHGDIEDRNMETYEIGKGNLNRLPTKRIYLYERGSQGDILANVHNTYMWVSNMPESVLSAGNLVLRKCASRKIINRDILIYRNGHIFSNDEKSLIECIKSRIEKLNI